MPPQNVLFVSSRNAVRSIMAEVLLNTLGGGRFRAFSAGTLPSGRVDPMAVHVLQYAGYPVEHVRSKSWDEFLGARAPKLDFVIAVCGADETLLCPPFSGEPVTTQWIVDDPSQAHGDYDERRLAFAQALALLRRRVQNFTSLPFESVDRVALRGRLREIGEAW